MDVLNFLLNAQIRIGTQTVLWREVLGNAFGLASALGGMRRRVWAWPVGIVGNALLFTVFLGTVFGTPSRVDLIGQAGRQVMFAVVSVYGWYRWTRRDASQARVVIEPRWATWWERVLVVVVLIGGTLALTPLFTALGSYDPVWTDAWIFTGSLIATYGMARGWVEFWLVWVAVDAVGVPTLFHAHYYATGLMYVIYGAFTIYGFTVWARQRLRPSNAAVTLG